MIFDSTQGTFELTIDDLRDITNSLAGSPLDINDINNYQTIKVFINLLQEKSCNKIKTEKKEGEKDAKDENSANLTDVDFLNLIPYTKVEGIEINGYKEIFEKSAKNQPKLLVLFENRKGFESSKEDIRAIMEKSIIEIFYVDNKTSFDFGYNCKCLFKKKTKVKNLKELIVLQQLASLSQSKEKKEENKTLNTFIDLIENIKDIIFSIQMITSKGFPQKFFYEIKIDKGELNCIDKNIQNNEKKNLNDVKNFLRNLLQNPHALR